MPIHQARTWPVWNTASLILLASALLSACGGGSGGSAGSTSASTLVSASVSQQVPVTVAADGSSRVVQSSCPITQALTTTAVGDGLRINDIKWLQTVQLDSAAATSWLVANKDVMVRIDVLANAARAIPDQLALRIFDPATGVCNSITLTTPGQVPASLDQATLNTAFVGTIPATMVKPGMGATVQVDDSTGRSATEANQTYRYVQPQVVSIAAQVIKIVPITVAGMTGHFTSTDDMAALIKRLYPVSDVTVTMAAPVSLSSLALTHLTASQGLYVGTLGIMSNALSELDDVCNTLNGVQKTALSSPKCVGLFPDNLTFEQTVGSGQVVGLAYVGGTTLLANSVVSIDDPSVTDPYHGAWLTSPALTIAHEVGHLFGLNHGNCGGATILDARLYPDGRLDGGAGYDSLRQLYFSSTKLNPNGTPIFADLMSYCTAQWSSDHGYLAALSYLSSATAGGTSVVTPSADAATSSDTVTSHTAVKASALATQWLKLSLTPSGWQVRRTHFAPGTLKASSLSALVSSQQGTDTLPLQSAVISTGEGVENYGPFYVDAGHRQMTGLQVMSNGVAMAQLTVPTQ